MTSLLLHITSTFMLSECDKTGIIKWHNYTIKILFEAIKTHYITNMRRISVHLYKYEWQNETLYNVFGCYLGFYCVLTGLNILLSIYYHTFLVFSDISKISHLICVRRYFMLLKVPSNVRVKMSLILIDKCSRLCEHLS